MTECAEHLERTEVIDTFLISTKVALDAMAILSDIRVEPIPTDDDGNVTIGGYQQSLPANSVALKVQIPQMMSIRDFKRELLDTERRLSVELSPLGAAYRDARAREATPPQRRNPVAPGRQAA